MSRVLSTVALLIFLFFSGPVSAHEKVVVIPLSNSSPKAPVAKTGQATSYFVKDDGALQAGVEHPASRFVDNQDGTVTDHLTGLIWLKETHCTRFYPLDFAGTHLRVWQSAIAASNGLRSGFCGLSDDSAVGDWRMPNVRELESLIDFSQMFPAVPPSFPLADSQAIHGLDYIWSSTTYTYKEGNAWCVDFYNGATAPRDKTLAAGIWPVRGGKP